MTVVYRMVRGMRDVAFVVSLLAVGPIIPVAQAQVDRSQGELRGGERFDPGTRRHGPQTDRRRYGPESDDRRHGPGAYDRRPDLDDRRPELDERRRDERGFERRRTPDSDYRRDLDYDRRRDRDERYDGRQNDRRHEPSLYRNLNSRVNPVPSVDVHVEGLDLDARVPSRNERDETGSSICRQASGTTWSTQAQTCSDEAPAQRANTWSTSPDP